MRNTATEKNTDQSEGIGLITLPEPGRGRVEEKLKAYEVRLKRYQTEYALGVQDIEDAYLAPELLRIGRIPVKQLGTLYKIAIAKELLEKGEVDTMELGERLSEEHEGFAPDRFQNACAVLHAYAEGHM